MVATKTADEYAVFAAPLPAWQIDSVVVGSGARPSGFPTRKAQQDKHSNAAEEPHFGLHCD
jgi:hypothetical protein